MDLSSIITLLKVGVRCRRFATFSQKLHTSRVKCEVKMAKPLWPTRRRIGPPARRLNMKGNPKLTSGAQPHLR